jgi:hypothetical protein
MIVPAGSFLMIRALSKANSYVGIKRNMEISQDLLCLAKHLYLVLTGAPFRLSNDAGEMSAGTSDEPDSLNGPGAENLCDRFTSMRSRPIARSQASWTEQKNSDELEVVVIAGNTANFQLSRGVSRVQMQTAQRSVKYRMSHKTRRMQAI